MRRGVATGVCGKWFEESRGTVLGRRSFRQSSMGRIVGSVVGRCEATRVC